MGLGRPSFLLLGSDLFRGAQDEGIESIIRLPLLNHGPFVKNLNLLYTGGFKVLAMDGRKNNHAAK
jgi:hypothetical protein